MVDFALAQRRHDQINRYTPAPKGQVAVIYCDGACPKNPGPMGIGFIIELGYSIEFGTRFGTGSNNAAEYLALIWALRSALREGVTHAEVYMDSQLVVNQVMGSWACRDNHLRQYLSEVQGLRQMFVTFSATHIPREENEDADYLSHHPTDPAVHPAGLEINLQGKRIRKFTRQQAAMIRWWWKTHRCTNEYRLARVFNATPSHMGRIGRGELYKDVSPADLPNTDTDRELNTGFERGEVHAL